MRFKNPNEAKSNIFVCIVRNEIAPIRRVIGEFEGDFAHEGIWPALLGECVLLLGFLL
jgi:hypothetical protein